MMSDREAALALVHAISGDSWGLQEALVRPDDAGFEEGFTALWPALWKVGHLLRTHLPAADRAALVERLRAQIAAMQVGGVS